MLRLDEILAGLPAAWIPETADPPVQLGAHPASRQCTVSSLLIQRHFGGIIVRCEVGVGSNATIHYFNDINGIMIDSTRAQFRAQSPYRKFKKNPDPNTYIFDDTWPRVDILEARIRAGLEH